MRPRRWAAAVLVAAALPVGFPDVGVAVAPVRVAWWSEAAVAGTALPAPTTDAGGLQVAQGATGPESFAALHYAVAGQPGPATLTLVTTPNSTLGTPALEACRTTAESWRAGGDQPASSAPGYDCSAGVTGAVSADGTTVSFALPPGVRDALGDLDVVVAPTAGSVPFQTSFAAPTAASLTVATPASALPASGAPATPAVTSAPAPVAALAGRPAPARPVAVPAPVPAPAGALTAPSPVLPAPAPVVAPASPAPEAAVTPALAGPVRSSPDHSRKVVLALLFLVVDLVIVAAMQPPRAPRLLGGVGRGRPAPEPAAPVGGLGRYARPRLTPPRRIV